MTQHPTPDAFIAKWQQVTTRRASAQSRFLDLCDLLGVPEPLGADPIGKFYAFKRPMTKFSR